MGLHVLTVNAAIRSPQGRRMPKNNKCHWRNLHLCFWRLKLLVTETLHTVGKNARIWIWKYFDISSKERLWKPNAVGMVTYRCWHQQLGDLLAIYVKMGRGKNDVTLGWLLVTLSNRVAIVCVGFFGCFIIERSKFTVFVLCAFPGCMYGNQGIKLLSYNPTGVASKTLLIVNVHLAHTSLIGCVTPPLGLGDPLWDEGASWGV